MYHSSMNSSLSTDVSFWSLIRAGHALEERLESTLSEVGLSSAKYGALHHLVEAREPLSLSDLAAKVACVRSNITQLVDRLESDGLVRRISDPDDRRSVRAEVTPLGRERHAAGSERVGAVQKEFTQALSDADRQALERALALVKK